MTSVQGNVAEDVGCVSALLCYCSATEQYIQAKRMTITESGVATGSQLAGEGQAYAGNEAYGDGTLAVIITRTRW